MVIMPLRSGSTETLRCQHDIPTSERLSGVLIFIDVPRRGPGTIGTMRVSFSWQAGALVMIMFSRVRLGQHRDRP